MLSPFVNLPLWRTTLHFASDTVRIASVWAGDLAPGLGRGFVGPRESVTASSGSQRVFYNYLVFCHEVVDF